MTLDVEFNLFMAKKRNIYRKPEYLWVFFSALKINFKLYKIHIIIIIFLKKKIINISKNVDFEFYFKTKTKQKL